MISGSIWRVAFTFIAAASRARVCAATQPWWAQKMVRVFEPFEMLKLAPWLADARGKITAAGNRTYGFCQSTTRAHETPATRDVEFSAGSVMKIPTRRARKFLVAFSIDLARIAAFGKSELRLSFPIESTIATSGIRG